MECYPEATGTHTRTHSIRVTLRRGWLPNSMECVRHGRLFSIDGSAGWSVGAAGPHRLDEFASFSSYTD